MDAHDAAEALALADASLRAAKYDGAALAVERLFQRYEGVWDPDSPRPRLTRFEHRRSLADTLVRGQSMEHLIALDATGAVLLYLRGDASHVAIPHVQGQVDLAVAQRLWRAACMIHNHPIETRRPIGGTFSLGDISLAERFQVSELRVASVEATYSLAAAAGSSWHQGWIPSTERAYGRAKAALEHAMSASMGASAQRDIYFFLRTLDFLMLQLAKRLNMTYQRLDRPRDEWEIRIPSTRPEPVNRHAVALIDDTAHFRWLRGLLRKIPLQAGL